MREGALPFEGGESALHFVADDDGVDEVDDGFLVLVLGVFEFAEAFEESEVVQRSFVGLVAGDEEVDGGAEGLGEFGEGLHGRVVEAALVLVDQGGQYPDHGGQVLLGPLFQFPERLQPRSKGLEDIRVFHGFPSIRPHGCASAIVIFREKVLDKAR